MTTANRNAVVHTITGAVLRYGFSDFLNDYDPIIHTIVPLDWNATPVKNVELCYQKIVAAYFIEMSDAEKMAVDIAGLSPKHVSRRYPDAEMDPVIGDDGDRYYNTLLGLEMQYDITRGKWLSDVHADISAGRNGITPPGSYYKGSDGRTMSDTRGFSAQYNGTVVAISYSRDYTNTATFEITASGIPIAELISTNTNGFYNHLDGDFQQGDILSVRNKVGSLATEYASINFKVRWRI